MSCVEVWQGSMVRVGTMGRYYVQDEKNNFGFFCECSSFYGTNITSYTYGLGMVGTASVFLARDARGGGGGLSNQENGGKCAQRVRVARGHFKMHRNTLLYLSRSRSSPPPSPLQGRRSGQGRL